MRIYWIGTEGRGWNWGYRLETKRWVFRARVLSWFPFVRFGIRYRWLDEYGFPKETTLTGITFPSDAPHFPEFPAAHLWSAYDRRIRQKHGLPVR